MGDQRISVILGMTSPAVAFGFVLGLSTFFCVLISRSLSVLGHAHRNFGRNSGADPFYMGREARRGGSTVPASGREILSTPPQRRQIPTYRLGRARRTASRG